MNPPLSPPPQEAPDNQTIAIVVLILGVGSWLGLSLLGAIPAVILARIELAKVKRGEVTARHQTLLQVGFWAGAVNLVLGLLGLVFGLLIVLLTVLGVGVAGIAGGAG